MDASSQTPADAIAHAVREALMARHSVHLPGLGTLRVEHRPSASVLDADQQRVLAPPRDVVAFDPQSA